jgi:hypothetical protein
MRHPEPHEPSQVAVQVRAGCRVTGCGPNRSEGQLRLCLHPRMPEPAGDRGERLDRLGRASPIRLGQLHLDQLGEERDGDEVVPC